MKIILLHLNNRKNVPNILLRLFILRLFAIIYHVGNYKRV